VSALGKTTNALEAIFRAACAGNRDEARRLASDLEQAHREYVQGVLSAGAFDAAWQSLAEIFTELHWAVDDVESSRPDYHYDQIVCTGELLSTRIFSHYLKEAGFAHHWVDARDLIRTDATHRDARVDTEVTNSKMAAALTPLLHQGGVVLTQGFIGATSDNASTTLGREGSDYTAALLAAALNADSVTIWKDVDGLQNADPKLFPNTVKIEAITYAEVIEMAYYGAQVIHPKTIKPLQNSNIPLYVRCFLEPKAKGTAIEAEASSLFYPPLIILKENQVLLQVTTRDFSFVTEENLSRLYSIFSDLKVKINLLQNAAISFVACIDRDAEKLEKLIASLEADYKVLRNEGVKLLTVRHHTPEILFDLTKHRHVLLEQKTRQTVQLVMK
jgi:aspartate kinase